jgi:glucosamine-6-phosphate deaminase
MKTDKQRKQKKLFVVGDLCLDALQEIEEGMEFGEEHGLRSLDFSIGGNAANFAVITSKLGLQPLLISAIGNDFATPFLRKHISGEGVRSRLIASNRPNAFSFISVRKRGERAIQSVKNCLDEISARKIERMLLPKISAGDIVFFGGFYHLRNLRPGFRRLLKRIKRKRGIICFDTCFDTQGRWNINHFLPMIDFLFVNDIELKHIAKGSSPQAKANSLLKKGVGMVVLKRAAQGAAIFEKGLNPIEGKAIRVKAIDTTGAGDAFNAGFIYGVLRGWSQRNCMLSGNFVAASKIQHHGLVAPSTHSIDRFIKNHNKPTIIITSDYNKMSSSVASIVTELLKRKPDASIVLPTGETPKQLYKILSRSCKRKRISFNKVRLFQLDEYVGPHKKKEGSFSFFLEEHLLKGINKKKKNVHLLNGAAKNLRKDCAKHEAAVKRHGIDLCILGIAPNGHVGFNEPGSSASSKTRVVKLRPATIKKNAKYFPGVEVPSKGITMGLGTIRDNCRQILLLASGSNKAKAIRASLHSNNSKKWPAVALRSHKNITYIVDRAAYSM